MFTFLKRAAIVFLPAISFLGLAETVPWPSPDTELNDVDPRVPLGGYIQYESSNTISKVVVLTNGVLTVGNESINVAEPSHTVVTTNVIEGRVVITTNTYDAVYQDNLDKELEAYATIKKAIITPNEDGTYTTNYVDVAYVNDLPPDNKKADKVINLWEYYCPQVGGILGRADSKVAPFAAWAWDGDTNGIYHIDLMYTGGVWTCSVNAAAPPLTVKGDENAKSLNFGDYTFTSTNENGVAYVVYTDALRKARQEFIDNELSMFVAKTNMAEVADRIQEDQLNTIQGIVDALIGIRKELLSISGERGLSLHFVNVASGDTLNLASAEISGLLGKVEIDWGDGTKSITNFPCSHTYGNNVTDTVEVVISGMLRAISGQKVGNDIYPFASWEDNNNGRLLSVKIDRTVGLEEFGDYAFANTGISDLTFARDARISRFGQYCFYSSGITTLYGMPDVQKIPDYCFSKCPLVSLNGLGENVREIGDGAFSECTTLRSLSGISTTAGPVAIGAKAFYYCTSLLSLSGLEQTSISVVPFRCFMGCSNLTSIAYLPQGLTEIGDGAFSNTGLTSLNGVPSSLTVLGDNAFRNCSELSDARALWNTSLELVGQYVFSSCPMCSITFPESLSCLGQYSLGRLDVTEPTSEGYKSIVKFRGKTLIQAQQIPVSPSDTNTFGFSWGLHTDNTNDTLIIGIDGEMYYDPSESAWVTNSTVLSFSMNGVPANTTVRIGNVEEAPTARDSVFDGRDIAIDWGDGTIDYETTHTYSSAISPVIKVYGKAVGISGLSDTQPFIKVEGSYVNNYLTEVSFDKCYTFNALGSYSFAGCSALQSINGLSENIVSLGEGCFKDASSVTNLFFLSGTSITEVPKECFMGCFGITSLEGLPNSITTIGDGSFRRCYSLKGLDYLPSSVLELPDNSFRECTSLTNLDGTTVAFSRIGQHAFADCVNIADVSLSRTTQIGAYAFERVGSDASAKTDEDGITFKVIYSFPNGTYEQAAASLGLDTESGIPTSGIEREISKIACMDEEQLVWHSEGTIQRWEVLIPALEIELKDVTSNTTFQVARTWVTPQASVIWNWGDGTSLWVSQSPSPHTYTNTVAQNYTIRVKGLLESISSEGGAAGGAYLRPLDEIENPFLFGFRVPENTPVKSIGNYSFSRCPNLKNINRTNLPRSRALAPPVKRGEPITRLDKLFQSRNSLPIEYGEFCFYGSGIEDLSGLPTNATYLAEGLFSRNESLKSLQTLPGDYVTDMGERCFEYTGLTNLVGYPPSLGYVSTYAFANCYDLISLYGLPQNVTDIGYGAFRGASSLQSLANYPPMVGYVTNYCFAENSSITNLDGLQESPIATIGEGAFAACTSLENLYGTPDSVKHIGLGSFFGTALYSLTNLPVSVTNIEQLAFAYCLNLPSLDSLGTNVTTLGKMAFMGCTNMRDVAFMPQSDAEIGDSCFSLDGNVTNVFIAENVKKVGFNSFKGVGGYSEQRIDDDGDSVTCTIYFNGRTCSQIRELWSTNFDETLSSVKLYGKDGYIVNKDGVWVDMITKFAFRVSVPANAIVAYGDIITETNECANIEWGDESENDDDPEPYLGGNAHRYKNAGNYEISFFGRNMYEFHSSTPPFPFIYSTNSTITINSMEIGNHCGLQKFGDSCFRGYSSLTSIWNITDWPIIELGDFCFEGCSGIENLSGLAAGLNSIGRYCFANCSSLKDISALKDMNIYLVPDSCFENCGSLLSLNGIPKYANVISNRVFASCVSLTNLDGLPDSVKFIGDYAFSNCTALTSIDGTTNSVAAFGEGCFMGCTSLADIGGFGNGALVLPKYSFRDCTALKSIENLAPFSTIGEACFSNCTSLADVGVVLYGQKEIPTSMFAGCTSITNFNFVPSTVTSYWDSVFYGCTGLKDVIIGDSVRVIGNNAFGNCINVTNMQIRSSSISLGTTSLYRLGETNPLVEDEYGLLYSAIVKFSEYPCSAIKAMSGFPFSAPNTTRFVGNDGIIMKINGNWEILNVAMMVSLTPEANVEYELGNVVIQSGKTATVMWGDGATSELGVQGRKVSHRYASPAPVSLWINGGVKEISYGGVNGSFICKKNGQVYVEDNMAVTAITIPDGSALEKMGSHAFASCHSLTSLVVNSMNFQTVGEYAFSRCENLTNLVFNADGVTSLGMYSFYFDTGLDNLDWIPSSVTRVDEGCFAYCSSLEDIGKNSLVSISNLPYRCFHNCTGLGSNFVEVVCPPGITNIDNNAFEGCSRLSRLTIQDNVNRFGAASFTAIGADNPSQTDIMGNSYKSKVYLTFISTDGLRGKSGFPFGAESYTTFMCSDGIIYYDPSDSIWKTIKYGLVCRLSGIQAGDVVSIGDVETSPGKTYEVSFGDGTPSVSSLPASHTYQRYMSSCYVSVIGEIDKINANELSLNPWIKVNGTTDKLTAIEILLSSKLKDIGNSCFYASSNLVSASILATTITNVGDSAFMQCVSLPSMDLSRSIARIGSEAFRSCEMISDVKIDSRSVPLLAERAFYLMGSNMVGRKQPIVTVKAVPMDNQYLSSIAQWIIPAKDAASYSVAMPETVLAHELLEASTNLWGAYQFVKFSTVNGEVIYTNRPWQASSQMKWRPLEWSIVYDIQPRTLPKLRCIRNLGEHATQILPFHDFIRNPNADRPLSIHVGEELSMSEIEEGSFAGFSALTNIYVGERAKSSCRKIGVNAFYGCENLEIGVEHFNLPEVIDFGDYAMAKCNKLTDIRWLSMNAVLGKGCFEGCSGLTSLEGFPSVRNSTYPSRSFIVPERCFLDCSGLTSLAGIANTVTNIKEYAFGNCLNLLDMSVWPTGLVSIGSYAFGPTGNLISAWNYEYGMADYIKNIRCATPVISLPSSLKEIGLYAFCGVAPYLYEHTAFDLTAAKIESLSAKSFAGSPMVVFSTNNLAQIYKAFERRYPTTISEEYVDWRWGGSKPTRYAVYGPELLRSWLPMGSIITPDGTYVAQRDTQTTSDLGWYDNVGLFAYSKRENYNGKAITYVMKNVPAETPMYSRPHDVVRGVWGSGESFTNNANYFYGTGGDYLASILYTNGIVRDCTADAYPVIGATANSNPFVDSVIIGEMESLGDYSFGGLVNCREVSISASTMPSIKASTFLNLGMSLPLSTTVGIRHKAMVCADNVYSEAFTNSVAFPFGVPNETLFRLKDGYLTYENGGWELNRNKMSYRIVSRRSRQTNPVTKYTISGKVKMEVSQTDYDNPPPQQAFVYWVFAGWHGSTMTITYQSGSGLQMFTVIDGCEPVRIVSTRVMACIAASQTKTVIREQDVSVTVSKQDGERFLQEFQDAGILKQNNSAEWIAYGKNVLDCLLVDVTVRKITSSGIELFDSPYLGPFYWRGDGTGKVDVTRVRADLTGGSGNISLGPSSDHEGSIIKNGEKYYIYMWEPGEHESIVTIDGELEKIGGFIRQDKVLENYPPSYSFDINWGMYPSLKEIGSWDRCYVSPAAAKFPNTITKFGDGCFSNDSFTWANKKYVDEFGTNYTYTLQAIGNLNWLPTSLESIGGGCFSGQSQMTVAGIGNCTNLVDIGTNAFDSCTRAFTMNLENSKLWRCYFPSSVEYVGLNAFKNTWGSSTYNQRYICFKGKTMDQIIGMKGYPWLGGPIAGSYGLPSFVEELGGKIGWEDAMDLLPNYWIYGTDGYIKGNNEKVQQHTGL
ncbi:MAG: leucine-rich repeat protein [Prevotella sp.]|nr:leucine-rich repeat protein [Prevotella sp.]